MIGWNDLKDIDVVHPPSIEDKLDVKQITVSEYKNQPFFATKKQLDQYCNEALYLFEKRLLQWAEVKMKDPKFITNRRARIFSMSAILKELYGRPWTPKLDQKYKHIYARVLKYYSSTVRKSYWDKEKKKYTNSLGYVLSVSRLKKCVPYSLKLRYEMFEANNIDVTDFNMRLPKDNLKAGHSRNPITEKKCIERAEEGRRNYEQWLNNQRKNTTS